MQKYVKKFLQKNEAKNGGKYLMQFIDLTYLR